MSNSWLSIGIWKYNLNWKSNKYIPDFVENKYYEKSWGIFRIFNFEFSLFKDWIKFLFKK